MPANATTAAGGACSIPPLALRPLRCAAFCLTRAPRVPPARQPYGPLRHPPACLAAGNSIEIMRRTRSCAQMTRNLSARRLPCKVVGWVRHPQLRAYEQHEHVARRGRGIAVLCARWRVAARTTPRVRRRQSRTLSRCGCVRRG